jgi:hypothetical protein
MIHATNLQRSGCCTVQQAQRHGWRFRHQVLVGAGTSISMAAPRHHITWQQPVHQLPGTSLAACSSGLVVCTM